MERQPDGKGQNQDVGSFSLHLPGSTLLRTERVPCQVEQHSVRLLCREQKKCMYTQILTDTYKHARVEDRYACTLTLGNMHVVETQSHQCPDRVHGAGEGGCLQRNPAEPNRADRPVLIPHCASHARGLRNKCGHQ